MSTAIVVGIVVLLGVVVGVFLYLRAQNEKRRNEKDRKNRKGNERKKKRKGNWRKKGNFYGNKKPRAMPKKWRRK